MMWLYIVRCHVCSLLRMTLLIVITTSYVDQLIFWLAPHTLSSMFCGLDTYLEAWSSNQRAPGPAESKLVLLYLVVTVLSSE